MIHRKCKERREVFLMKRLVSRKKRSKVSLLISLMLCVVCICGQSGIPLTVFAETETPVFTEEAPVLDEDAGGSVETEMTSESITSTVSDQNGSGSNGKEETVVLETSDVLEKNEKAPGEETMTVSETEEVQESESGEHSGTESESMPGSMTNSCTVSFSVGADAIAAGVSVPESVSVNEDETIGNLPVPVWNDEGGKSVKVFGGWYMDEGFTRKFDTGTPVKSNMTVYAKWDVSEAEDISADNLGAQNSILKVKIKPEDSCTVSFNIGAEAAAAGVSVSGDITVTKNKNAGSLPVPVWNNTDGEPVKAFGGWYTGEDFSEVFDSETVVSSDITLYAKWNSLDEKELYYVSFYSRDGASVCSTISVSEGQMVSPPDPPVLENMVFLGWSETMQEEPLAEVSEEMEWFDFTVAVSAAAADGGNILKLYAWYGDSLEMDEQKDDVPALGLYKVSFSIGADAEEAGVAVPEDVFVNEKGTVDNLPTPVWMGEDGNPEKAFGGWYLDEEFKTEFDTDTVISSDTVVYAKWNGFDEEDLYYVNFFNQDGSVVCLTLSVEENRTVNPPDNAPVVENKIFRGWSSVLQGDSLVTDIVKFDFSKTVSEAVADGSNTLNLYAWYGDEVSVSFVSNGGMAVPTAVIAAGEMVEEPITEREGYTFRGWSESNTEFMEFDFTAPVITSITLYAFWEPKLVPVTLVYMYENANDSEYSPAGAGQTVYAPAGSYLSIRKNNITALNQTHDIIYSNDAGGEAVGNASGNASGTGRATLPDIRDTYFQYSSASNNRFVMPDGSTVMLIYYNRARVTLKFTYGLSNNASIDVNARISAADQAKYNVQYIEKQVGYWTKYNVFDYSFTAKYGENIVPVWPQIGWVENDSSGGNQFYGWRKSNNDIQVTNMYTLERDLFNQRYITNGVLVCTGNLPAVAKVVSVLWAIYARTTLPGERPDFVSDGKNYTIYTEACQKLYIESTTNLGYKQLEGCTPISGTPTFAAKYYNMARDSITSGSFSVRTANNSSMQQVFDSIFPDQINHGTSNWDPGDRCQILLYDRNKISLSLHVNDDTYGINVQKEDYLYNDWIYNDDTDLLKTVEAGMEKKNYIFAGWYTDSRFTDGTQYVPDINSRISGNMELYAKWEPNQFTARFYLYTDDESVPYREEGFAEGGRITDWTVPPAVQDIFLGWYWYQDGRLQPFDFTSAVGQNHVDQDGILKLYARWNGTEGKVSYLPGAGGDNSTQEVFDERKYEINAASVMLPSYDSVWKDNSVPSDKSMTFVGWKAPNGAIYQPGRYVPVTRILMQFEAQWSRDAVKLIYNANGGSGNDVSETWDRGSVVTVWDNMDASTPHFVRQGYELAGWDENSNAEVPSYKLGEGSITLTSDITILYAIWRPISIDVTIRKMVAGSMGDITKSFDFIVSCDREMAEGDGYTLSEGSKEARFSLKHDGSIVLKGVRIGSTLTIYESNADGYEMTFTVGTDPKELSEGSYTIPLNASEPINITVINRKEGEIPDTGVLLDSVPYILILMIVIVGTFMFLRKRRNHDDD